MRVARPLLTTRALCLFVLASASAGACRGPNPAYHAALAPAPSGKTDGPVRDAKGGPVDGPDATGAVPTGDDASRDDGGALPDPSPPADAGNAPEVAGPAADVPVAQDTAPTTGLLAAFDFDEAPIGAGKSVGDPFGNTATLRGSTNWGTDIPSGARRGISLQFPGGDSYVQLSFVPSRLANSAGDKSVAFWCKSTDPGTPTRTLIALYNQSKATSVGLQIGIGETKIEAWPYGLTFRNLSFTTATPRAWHHVAYTFAAAKHVLYVDGVEVDSSTTWAPKAGVLDVARLGTTDETASPPNFYLGFLRGLRIYDRALDAGEVRTLAASP